MSRTTYRLIAMAIAFLFGAAASVDTYLRADGAPGAVGWLLIVVNPILFPALVAVIFNRFFLRHRQD